MLIFSAKGSANGSRCASSSLLTCEGPGTALPVSRAVGLLTGLLTGRRCRWAVLPPTAASASLSPVELPQRHDHPKGGGRPGRWLYRRGETRRRHALLSPGPGGGEPFPCEQGCWPPRRKTRLEACLCLHPVLHGVVLTYFKSDVALLDKTMGGGFPDVCRQHMF